MRLRLAADITTRRQQRRTHQTTTRKPLQFEQVRKCRSHVARCRYLDEDRADTTFSVKRLCRRMASPTKPRHGETEEAHQTVARRERDGRDRGSTKRHG